MKKSAKNTPANEVMTVETLTRTYKERLNANKELKNQALHTFSGLRKLVLSFNSDENFSYKLDYTHIELLKATKKDRDLFLKLETYMNENKPSNHKAIGLHSFTYLLSRYVKANS